jgi:flagellar biosynthetic protein FliO
MPALLQASHAVPGGYGAALLQTLFALAGVCVLAWVVLRWGAQRGFGTGRLGGNLRVVERIPLDPRRALYVVKAGERVLLLGVGDGAAPVLLTELDPSLLAAQPAAPAAGASFREVLARLRGPTPPAS